ncbi:MAG: hypothetical protein WDW38_007949 [Sanguina aurantia]
MPECAAIWPHHQAKLGEESRPAFEYLMECGGHYNTNVFLSVQPGDELLPDGNAPGRVHQHHSVTLPTS